MKTKFLFQGFLTLSLLTLLAACTHHGNGPGPDYRPTTTYEVTLTNAVNYLNALVFNTPVGATEPGPLTQVGQKYTVSFQAVPGASMSFATMSGVSNDWYFAPSEEGIPLFNGNDPVTGDISHLVYLWDNGTEEEDPEFFGGMDTGVPDDDITNRVVADDVTGYLSARLEYDASSRTFYLTLENIRGVDVEENPIAISPGVVILHAQSAPLFDSGAKDRGHGLEGIARSGNPTALYEWFTATASDGSPLRLSSSFTIFAPGVLYAFNGNNPVFKEMEPATPESGIEKLAEDGGGDILFDYLTQTLELPAALSSASAPIFPGESMTFILEVPRGHKLGMAAMFVHSNDWFVSFDPKGLNTGQAMKEYPEVLLFDAGTEADQPIGLGADQAPFQSGPNTGAEDPIDYIRRVEEIVDYQFGKGGISSGSGLASTASPGGYNVISVKVKSY